MATVLVVDDVASNRDFAAVLLGYRGHVVIEAADGTEALARIHESHPDVVVSDVLMPGMDGLEMVHRLRADDDPHASHAPVIFYTANYLEPETRPIAEACGVSRVVLRGSDPSDLLDAVDEALLAGPIEVPAGRSGDFERAHAQALQANLIEKVRVLRHTEHQFEATTAASPIGIALLDAKGEAVYVNGRFVEITGEPAGRLLGDGWLCCLEPAARPEALALLRRPPAEAVEHRYRTRAECRSEVRWLRVHLRPYRDPESGIAGAVAVVDDITDVVDAEERATREAARRAEDARRLDTERLDSLRRMAGGVAHDFNNLLGAMLGFLQLAADTIAEEAAAGRLADTVAAGLLDDLGQVTNGGEQAAKLTEQLLAFGRRGIQQSATIDLNAFLQSQAPELSGARVTVELTLCAGRPCIVIAPDGLERLLRNLVQNAREAMPDGGIVAIATSVADRQVILTVSDTGTGMTPDVLERGFEPFYTTKQNMSRGLGLSMVHGTVTQASGDVQLRSAVGRGTTVTIALPVAEEEPTVTGSGFPSPGPGAAPRPAEAPTVLLVDDDNDLRQVVARFIDKAGYRVLAASGGREALELVARHEGPIHCLVCDVVMPGMDGRQLAHRIAAERPETSIVFISGYAEALIDDDGRSLEPGATILGKPFTSLQLHEALRVAVASQ